MHPNGNGEFFRSSNISANTCTSLFIHVLYEVNVFPRHTLFCQNSPKDFSRHPIISLFQINKNHMQIFLLGPMMFHQLSHDMDCIHSRPSGHKSELVIRDVYTFSKPLLDYSLPQFHRMTHKFDSPIIGTLLDITFVLIQRDDSASPPSRWHLVAHPNLVEEHG
ncbi:hypothetical protein RND81_09G106600 [Saponaria officinalis]|uniref:Uncharacterized protein n=1 Tax=Saponaria officinalis TaxID=3572 RepID=A0AAW1IL68_SAPOF